MRAEVGGDEREAGDPRRQRAAGQEEVEARLDRAPRREPDAEDDDEVDREDRVVDPIRIQPDIADAANTINPLSPPPMTRISYPLAASSNTVSARVRASSPYALALGSTT